MKYRVVNGVCLDKCKIYPFIKIGSYICGECRYCIKKDEIKKIVICELYQNQETNRNGANK